MGRSGWTARGPDGFGTCIKGGATCRSHNWISCGGRRKAPTATKYKKKRPSCGVRPAWSRQAARLTGRGAQALEQARRQKGGGSPGPTGQPAPAGGHWEPAERQVCADGYVRVSPRQPIYTPPGYRRRLVWKGVGLFLCAGAILLLLGFLLRSGILAF